MRYLQFHSLESPKRLIEIHLDRLNVFKINGYLNCARSPVGVPLGWSISDLHCLLSVEVELHSGVVAVCIHRSLLAKCQRNLKVAYEFV